MLKQDLFKALDDIRLPLSKNYFCKNWFSLDMLL